jgi:HSP20 family molecular chaperone IbpA
MPNMYSNEIIPEFESLIDQISDKFFNYENRLFNNFAHQDRKILKQLPWKGLKRPCIHYGGDYIVTVDEKDDTLYFFHFLIPGHDHTTIDVMQKDGYIIIRTKDIKEELLNKDNPFQNYQYYKKVALTHPDYEVTEAKFKNGILSLFVKDMITEREKINTKMIEVKSGLEN